MAQLAPEAKDAYLSAFREFEKGLNGASRSPIHRLRRQAVGRFESLEFPTTADEAWRYTDVAPIVSTSFEQVINSAPPGLSAKQIEPFAFNGTELVFVNGHYAPELSSQENLPRGAKAVSLKAAVDSDDDLLSKHLGQYADYEAQPFTALNTAFVHDGALIYVPANTVVESPITILFVSTANGQPTVSHPRCLVIAESHSQLAIVETYAGLGTTPYFTNAITEIAAAEHAVVDHYKLVLEGAKSFHVATTQTCQGSASNVSTHAISLGGRLVRNEVNARLSGEGGEATVNGFYLLDESQHVDNHTLIEHVEPHCTSHELFKGILDEKSKGVFRGRIYVHQKAQKTDAYQTNQNLLLSDDAGVTAKPQLEIYADDVKCSHGTTIGQLDENAIFYLRSRGLGPEAARQILIQAFADEILDRIRVAPVRARLDGWVRDKFDRIPGLRKKR